LDNEKLVLLLLVSLISMPADAVLWAADLMVDHLMPRPDDIAMLFGRFAYVERGEGVFRVFHGVIPDPPVGFWFLAFYDWACFLIVHQPPGGIPWSVNSEGSSGSNKGVMV
jgi:hypothetical protein